MKVGITCNGNSNGFHQMFSNGCNQNVIMYYELFSLLGYDTYFLTHDSYINEFDKNPQDQEKRNICNDKEKYKNYKFINITNNNKDKFDCIFIIGTHLDDIIINKLKKDDKSKSIYIMLGKHYIFDVEYIIFDERASSILNVNFNEIWISPHFEEHLEYYKIRFKNENIFVGPYFWSPNITKNYFEHKIQNTINEINVAIMEPNLNYCKTCLIPISIAEKAHELINRTYVYNISHKASNKFLCSIIPTFNLFKNKKISLESRKTLNNILDECNVIITHQDSLELNYVYLEALYYGIPLIHNSDAIKDYGYYYPKSDVKIGAEQIENVLKNHNKLEYIKKNKPIIHKYSIHNEDFHTFIRNRLKQE